MIIKWRESYETGVEVMDNEHRELIEIINLLYQMQRDKKSYDELQDIYQRLLDYTQNHFQHEEKLMAESEYSGLEKQRQDHEEFVAKLKDMKEDLLSAKETAAPVVYKFLREWWLEHIVGMDKEYGPHLQGK